MNGQVPQRKEWPQIVDELKIAIHNTTISLELLKAQLTEAMAHARGK